MYRVIFFFMMFSLLTPGLAASHHPQAFLTEIKGSKTEGAQIVQHYCAMCHAATPLIQVGAPAMGNKAVWAPRMKAGMAVLFHHADEGLNAMPARGGCFECTDQQLMLAILALLPSNKADKNSIR